MHLLFCMKYAISTGYTKLSDLLQNLTELQKFKTLLQYLTSVLNAKSRHVKM